LKLLHIETSTHTYSLSEECFGYKYGRLKSSASHASRENTSLRCGKIQKWVRRLQRQSSMGAAYWLRRTHSVTGSQLTQTPWLCFACLFI